MNLRAPLARDHELGYLQVSSAVAECHVLEVRRKPHDRNRLSKRIINGPTDGEIDDINAGLHDDMVGWVSS